jgi:hypothetical protein
MSWHFSQVQVVEYLQANSLAGELSALLKLNPIPSLHLSKDRMREFSRLSRFGMTLKLLAGNLGEDLLTWYREDFLANLSVQPLTEIQLPQIYGLKCAELSMKSVHIGYSEKMSQSKQLDEPLKSASVMVIKPKSLLFPRKTWAQIIHGSDTGFLPAPTCAANFLAPSMYKHEGCRNYIRVFGLRNPRDGVKIPLLPKPTRETDSDAVDQEKQDKYARMWPYEPNQHPRPNPLDLEWMMGWVPGWTDIAPLGMDKFQQWQQQHFLSSQDNLKENAMSKCERHDPHEKHEECSGRERWEKGYAPKKDVAASKRSSVQNSSNAEIPSDDLVKIRLRIATLSKEIENLKIAEKAILDVRAT